MADWPQPSRWVSNAWALVTGADHGVRQSRAVGNAQALREILDLAEACEVPEEERRRWATDGFDAIVADLLPPSAAEETQTRQDQRSPPDPPALPPGRTPPELPPSTDSSA
jgi:hypothetical protein